MQNELILNRPRPCGRVVDAIHNEREQLIAAPDVEEWMRAAFIIPGTARKPGPITVNPDHDHLIEARIGVLWATFENVSAGKRRGGTCEMPRMSGDKWKAGRLFQQFREFFGHVPDFVITLDAQLATLMTDGQFCALVEHELYHCGHKPDRDGNPMYDGEDGAPLYYIRAHDVEEFTPIIARYGGGAAAGDSAKFVEASRHKPLFDDVELDCICGTCGR